MNKTIICAMTNNRVIGISNGLPWKIASELQYFKKNTINKAIIMGSNTFASINYKPLINRQNIVLTNNPSRFKLNFNYNNLIFATTVKDSITIAENLITKKLILSEIMIIGGANIYNQFLPLVNKLYLSIIKKDYVGDIYFPKINETEWKLVSSEEHEEFTAKIFERY